MAKVKLETVPADSGLKPAGSEVGTKIIARGRGGKFTKINENTRVSTTEINQQMRADAFSIDENDPQKRTKIQAMIDHLREMALDPDPEVRMATIKAIDLYLVRVLGKPDISDQAREDLATNQVKVVVINQKPLNSPTQEYKPAERPEPKFLVAENISTDGQ